MDGQRNETRYKVPCGAAWDPPTETIKRLRLPRGPALHEESTSAGLISDLHHDHPSSLLPLLHLLVPEARNCAHMSARGSTARHTGGPSDNIMTRQTVTANYLLGSDDVTAHQSVP